MNEQEIKISVKSDNLKSSENHLLHFIDIPLPIILVKRDKFSRYVLYRFNQSAQDIFNVPLERLINKEIRIFWPKETWDDFRKGIIASIRKGVVSAVDSIQIENQGRVRCYNLKIWKAGDSIACCVFLETIDKKLFTQSVLNERLKYEELFKITPVMMTSIDLNGKILDANLNWIEKTGYEKEELIGKNVQDYFAAESDSYLSKKTFSELLIANELKNVSVRIRKKQGGTISSIITARPLFDINGKFIRCYLAAHDVSEFEAVQQEYVNAEKLLKSLLENSASAILLYSPLRGIVECNLKAEKLFNLNKNQLIGKKIFELDLIKDSKSGLKSLKEIFSAKEASYPEKIELEINSFNNKKFIEISLTRIHLKDEPMLLMFFVDKSIEKIKDEKIQESEKRFQTLFEESVNALKLIDINGKILRLNRKAREIFEEFYDKNGEINISFKGFNYHRWLKDFIDSEKTIDQREYRIKTSNGLKIIDERLLKISFESGEKLIFSIGREVTKERLAEEELRKSEQTLRNLNDAKNRLIYILSHDLRAPTSSIIGVVNAILDEPNLQQKDIYHYLNLIKNAASYQLDLINNLLDWSLLESGNFNYTLEPENLEYAVYNSLNSIRGLIEQKKIKLDINIHSKLVLIDLNIFSRILINLVSNAVKFSYPESKIWIYSKILKNGRAEIFVKDNGVGFEKEILEKLFTFKEKISRHGTQGERGTGLGLSLCKDMINILGGKLKIQSPIKISKNKSAGSLVSFDVKIVEPKILISERLNKEGIKNILKKRLEGYRIISKDLGNYFRDQRDEYFIFIVLDKSDYTSSLVEKIAVTYKTFKNLIVAVSEQNNLPDDLKKTEPEKLADFLSNEIERIEFEWNQQISLAKQMKKMWA